MRAHRSRVCVRKSSPKTDEMLELNQESNPCSDDLHWYAVKVFWNRHKKLLEYLGQSGFESYTQNVIPALVFVRCTEFYITEMRRNMYETLMVYSNPVTRVPARIPEREMQVFKLVTGLDGSGLEFLGDDLPVYHEGDLVRVKEGPFKGAEGHIKRIKKDRRLVITITGVAAIATAHIHPSLLEKVEN